ncbi:hypothetical protein SELMODRAFT_81220 [Selaginella moellendorffii]|eukprot:XP_002964058.1 calcineurin B-like protein 2 [Selaginella moellendorffii]
MASLISKWVFSCFGGGAPAKDKLYNIDCLAKIASATPFQVCELEALHELFASLCQGEDRSFKLSKATWAQGCRMSARFFDMFDVDRDGRLNFDEFARGLAVFHPSTPRDAKIKFMFDFYDLQRKGFLVKSDIEGFLAGALPSGTNLDPIVDATFAEADTNLDGRIDRDEWKAMVAKHETILRPLTLKALQELTLAYPDFIFHVVDYNPEVNSFDHS